MDVCRGEHRGLQSLETTLPVGVVCDLNHVV